jgi:hypothetical protein
VVTLDVGGRTPSDSLRRWTALSRAGSAPAARAAEGGAGQD